MPWPAGGRRGAKGQDLVNRKKDVIVASGYKVWPREVEDVRYAHPAVKEAAVVGVPDEYRGEAVKAFVTLEGDTHTLAEELIALAKERLAAYKYPRRTRDMIGMSVGDPRIRH